MANRLAKEWANVKLLQFPTCWPIKGLFVHWSRGWGVLSFSECLVQAKVTKFGTKVGLEMLININSGFFIIIKKILAIFFHILQLCTRLPSSYDSDLGPFCSRQLRGLPSSDGYFFIRFRKWVWYCLWYCLWDFLYGYFVDIYPSWANPIHIQDLNDLFCVFTCIRNGAMAWQVISRHNADYGIQPYVSKLYWLLLLIHWHYSDGFLRDIFFIVLEFNSLHVSDCSCHSCHLFIPLNQLKESSMSLSHYPIDSNWVTATS